MDCLYWDAPIARSSVCLTAQKWRIFCAGVRARARRSWLKTIRHLLQHAVPTMRKNNPAAGVAQVKLPKSKGHWTWTDDQIA